MLARFVVTAEFVHLHVHSQFSLLNGAIRIDKLAHKASELGMRAVAVTDHGNMFGAVQLHRAADAAKIKPIVGCEVNVVNGSRSDESIRTAGHIVLLAESQEGYQNLVRIVSRGWVDGLVRGQPRVDLDLIRENRKGIVGLTACMAGHVPQEILLRGPEAGERALAQLRDVFEPGKLFVEIEDHGFPEQRPLNEILISLGKRLDLPLVATNCCHYLTREDARAQLVLQCIGAGRTVVEMERTHHKSEEIYLKSAAEMAARFSDVKQALSNTLLIAEMCAGKVDPLSKPKLPQFAVPDGSSEEAYLRELSKRGLEDRFAELARLGKNVAQDAYRARLSEELDVIASMGFPGYFLIVQDFIVWAKNNGVPVGPGRGSGAGSLVAYALRITDLDPIPYGLLFERFLNPERVSMPDFDVDFCMDKRDRVIEYVRDKYGRASVGQIATFHLLKSRSVVRDVGRVMGFAPADAGRIATLVPEPVQGKSVPIEKALEEEPRLKALYHDDANVQKLLDTAMSLENMTRHAGMHAAGIVMSEGPLWDHVPVFCPEPHVYVTQYDKDDVEAAGLVKFDFLGLKTLTVLDIAQQLIRKRPDQSGEPFSLERISLDDAATYALLQSGETTNVFQLESSGMQSLFKKLKPDCFEDIVAAVALYRPGPLGSGMVDDFVERKHGRIKVEYPHPLLARILKDTYGVIVYQEQVMQIAREMAGYSLGGADLLRRAMGKKKESEMAKQKATFLEGAEQKSVARQDADRVFELMAYFAGYGFNKSHSAAYALLTYQTAYLKAHFPVEFTAATLSADRDKIDKVVRTVAEARAMGITVLPPDVNESSIDFTVVYDPSANVKRPKNKPVCAGGTLRDPAGPRIRFGLGGVRGCGEAALDAIFEERSGGASGKKQPFVDLFDFCGRVDLRRVNKNVVEALIQCGGFDTMHEPLGVTRARAAAAVEGALERGRRIAQERNSGQTNLFALFGAADESLARAMQHPGGEFPKVEPWDTKELLAREKLTLGFYVSGHPLDRYASELKRFCNATVESLSELEEGTEVTVGGSIEGYRERNTKTGSKIAFFSLEDPYGRVEVIVRPRILEAEGVRTILEAGEPVIVRGQVQFESERGASEESETREVKLVLESVAPLAAEIRKKTTAVRVRLDVQRLDKPRLVALRRALEGHPGGVPVTIELAHGREWRVSLGPTGLSVEPSDAFLASLERLFGEKVCELR
jgi:DNA polymerase-3 subunit alpha